MDNTQVVDRASPSHGLLEVSYKLWIVEDTTRNLTMATSQAYIYIYIYIGWFPLHLFQRYVFQGSIPSWGPWGPKEPQRGPKGPKGPWGSMDPSGPWPRTGGGRPAAGGNRTQARAKAARVLKKCPAEEPSSRC